MDNKEVESGFSRVGRDAHVSIAREFTEAVNRCERLYNHTTHLHSPLKNCTVGSGNNLYCEVMGRALRITENASTRGRKKMNEWLQ